MTGTNSVLRPKTQKFAKNSTKKGKNSKNPLFDQVLNQHIRRKKDEFYL
jgi:hypothetical protein